MYFRMCVVIGKDEMICGVQQREGNDIKLLTTRGPRGEVCGWVKSDADWDGEVSYMSSTLGFTGGEAKCLRQIFALPGFRR